MRNIAVLFATACVCTVLTACGNKVSADCTKESMEVQNNESIEIESKVALPIKYVCNFFHMVYLLFNGWQM